MLDQLLRALYFQRLKRGIRYRSLHVHKCPGLLQERNRQSPRNLIQIISGNRDITWPENHLTQSSGEEHLRWIFSFSVIAGYFPRGPLWSYLMGSLEESRELSSWGNGEEGRDLRATSVQISMDCIPASSDTWVDSPHSSSAHVQSWTNQWKSVTGKSINTRILTHALLKDPLAKEKIKRDIKKYLEVNRDGTQYIKNSWGAAKVVLWGKVILITMSDCIKRTNLK